MTALRLGDLHASLADPLITSMNFLNEVTARYPNAVSFAPGAPYDRFLSDVDVVGSIRRYLDHRGSTMADLLLPYGATAGQINDLIADTLSIEEGIHVPSEAIVVTVGCQEALLVTLRALVGSPVDVLLTVNPCYVGLAGAARLLDLEVVGVDETEQGLDPDDVAAACAAIRRSGRRPRALYVVPDFANPSGHQLDLTARQRLLAVAEQQDILLLEDNPYGFTAAEKVPTLKALDTGQRVVYLGTMSKVCAPGVRVGFAVADQPVTDSDRPPRLLADALTALKSMITVNTSPITQAVVGGMLLDGAMRGHNKAVHYRANLVALTGALAATLPPGVTWRAPAGGFFAVLRLPFAAGPEVMEECAREYGVLFTPMRHFYVSSPDDTRIRLSCSNLTPAAIHEGVERLCRFIRSRLHP